jgi:hypothetical protein
VKTADLVLDMLATANLIMEEEKKQPPQRPSFSNLEKDDPALFLAELDNYVSHFPPYKHLVQPSIAFKETLLCGLLRLEVEKWTIRVRWRNPPSAGNRPLYSSSISFQNGLLFFKDAF